MESESPSGFNVKYKLRHFRKFKILVVVSVVVFILFVVFVVLYSIEKSKTFPAVRTPTCATRDCLFAAYDMVQQVNQSVDPCEDFYQYACGGWLKKNPLKDGETSKREFSILTDKNNEILKKAIESSWKSYSKNEAVMKTARFYNSCVDTDAVEATGDAPLRTLIRDIGGWHVTGNFTSGEPLISKIARINQLVEKKPLFSVKVFVNPYDSNAHILMLDRATVGMRSEYYLRSDDKSLKVRTAYQQYMKDVAKFLGGGNNSDALMMEVYNFEAELAKVEKKVFGGYSLDEHMQRAMASGGPLSIILTQTLEQFSNVSQVSLDLMLTFLNAVFQPQNLKFNKDEKIFAYPVNYFIHLFNLFANQTTKDARVIENYAVWTVINQLILPLPVKYSNAYERFRQLIVGNATNARWATCLNVMQKVLKMPLGLLYIDKMFNENSRKTIEEMSEYVRKSFLSKVGGYSWMNAETRENARQKVLAIQEDIGYPDYIKDPVKLAKEIKTLQFNKNLFENVRKMVKFSTQKNLGELRKPVNRDEWILGPSQTNGYYAPRQNRIVFLAGILQPPFYNPKYPKYLNYGGIGMVIGHEVLHGFDSTGRLFDKDGNIKNWWSGKSSFNFHVKANCLVQQYNHFTIFNQSLNGSTTLNENIADNGGIKVAYEGYKAWSKDHGTEGALPGLGLTVDQLFFIGFARSWCSVYTKEPALLQIKTDPHSNSKFRIIGTLQNFPVFAEAFQCKPNSYMNPVKKCSVW